MDDVKTNVVDLSKEKSDLFSVMEKSSETVKKLRNYYKSSNRGCWRRSSPWCVDGFHFPAVYAFYDNNDDIVYIGKTRDLSERMASHYTDGHLKSIQYDKVVKVMYSRCETLVDATILETILIPYYQPAFNSKDKGDLPTIVDVNEIVQSLEWECFFDNQIKFSDEKKQLKNKLQNFNEWSLSEQIDFISECYDKYILTNKDDGDDLFEMVLFKAIGNYMNRENRERICRIITKAYLPNISLKWFYFCRRNMCQHLFQSYGDIYRAFAHNYYASFDMVGFLCGYKFVTPLYLYAFDELKYHPDDADLLKSRNDIVCDDSIFWNDFFDDPDYEDMRDRYYDRFLKKLKIDWIDYNKRCKRPSKADFSRGKGLPAHIMSDLLNKAEMYNDTE